MSPWMRRWKRAALLAAMVGAACSVPRARAQEPSPLPQPKTLTPVLLPPIDTVVFEFHRAELEPKHWGFELHADGTGRYFAEGSPTATTPSGKVGQEIHVSAATMDLLMAGAKRDHTACETKAKHLANTGQKTLSYVHGDAWYTCTFNYSDSDAVMKSANAFLGLQETLGFGTRLQHEHRFDRLSLDAEMTSLETEVKEGRALEAGNIASVLRSIAEDEKVIERVRRKAARLVENTQEKTP